MEKVTRTQWMEDVLAALELASMGGRIAKSYAKRLLEENEKLEELAKRKRESVARRKSINAINTMNTKQKVLVDKAGNDRLKAILTEAMSIVNG